MRRTKTVKSKVLGGFEMAVGTESCPLCGWDASVSHLSDVDWINCVLCGEFKITRTLLRTAFAGEDSAVAKNLRPYLRAHTRQVNEKSQTVTLNSTNWR